MTDCKIEVFRTLAATGPLDAVEVASRIDSHPITVEHACARLRADGHIESVSGGRYQLTARGRASIESDASPETDDGPRSYRQ